MVKEIDSIIDGHKFHLHPDKVSLWSKLGDCYPIHVEIGATGRCNQNCVFCALDFVDNRREDIDRDVMLNALEDMAKPRIKYSVTAKIGEEEVTYYDRVKSVMFGGEGEPTLHKHTGLFVQKSKEYGLDVALTSNGVLFGYEMQKQCLPNLSWVKLSIDSGTSKNYHNIHRAPEKHFKKLIENVESSVKLKKENKWDVAVGTQYLMIPGNIDEEEIKKIIGIMSEIKPDYLSFKPYSDHPLSKKNLILSKDDYSKVESIINKLRPSAGFNIIFREETINRINGRNNYNKCYGLPFITLIDSLGNILPCNLFYGREEFTYGNLYKNSFSEIWNSQKRKEITKKIMEEGVTNCRRGCRCDAGNLYLNRIENPQPHDNFS